MFLKPFTKTIIKSSLFSLLYVCKLYIIKLCHFLKSDFRGSFQQSNLSLQLNVYSAVWETNKRPWLFVNQTFQLYQCYTGKHSFILYLKSSRVCAHTWIAKLGSHKRFQIYYWNLQLEDKRSNCCCFVSLIRGGYKRFETLRQRRNRLSENGTLITLILSVYSSKRTKTEGTKTVEKETAPCCIPLLQTKVVGVSISRAASCDWWRFQSWHQFVVSSELMSGWSNHSCKMVTSGWGCVALSCSLLFCLLTGKTPTNDFYWMKTDELIFLLLRLFSLYVCKHLNNQRGHRRNSKMQLWCQTIRPAVCVLGQRAHTKQWLRQRGDQNRWDISDQQVVRALPACG